MPLALLIAQHEQVQTFHLLTCPWGFTQKLQTGAHAGLVREAAYRNALAQIVPPIKVGQPGDDGLEREPVQRVARLNWTCGWRGFWVRWNGGQVIFLHGLIVDAKQAATICRARQAPSECSVSAFTHQPGGDHAREQTHASGYRHRFEWRLLDAVFGRGRGLACLVFDFVFDLQRGFLAVVRHAVQALIDLMGHLAEHGLGLRCRLVQTFREVVAQCGDGFGGVWSVRHGMAFHEGWSK